MDLSRREGILAVLAAAVGQNYKDFKLNSEVVPTIMLTLIAKGAKPDQTFIKLDFGDEWGIVNITVQEVMDALNPTYENNKCPVCGTMAETIYRQVATVSARLCVPPDPNPYVFCGENNYEKPYPFHRRCKKCNAGFFSDSVMPDAAKK